MRADQIQARAVAKIVVVALFWAALAVLLAIALLHTRTTLQWVAAAIFLGLALDPAVSLVQRAWPRGGSMPRVLAILVVYLMGLVALVFLVLHVFPPIVHDIEDLAKKLPGYIRDFENWANNNAQFQELNEKYHITQKLSEQASTLPSHLSSGASTLGSLTVSLLEHLLAAITVLTLTFFLLLDGGGMVDRGTGRLPTVQRDRARRIADRVATVVKAYVSVNLVLAIVAGFLTWVFLEAEGFHLALPLAVLVALPRPDPADRADGRRLRRLRGADDRRRAWRRDHLADPLPRLPAAAGPGDPAAALQGRGAEGESGVAIVAVIVGANLAGVLGALLAIPTAASLGVVIDELVFSGSANSPEPEPVE